MTPAADGSDVHYNLPQESLPGSDLHCSIFTVHSHIKANRDDKFLTPNETKMADPKELAATATGLCLNLDDFAPEWVTIQTILVLVSTGLAVFDTVTDWKVVLDFKDDGFKNPLLPPDEDWLRAWLVFASIGTFLTVISVVQDGHSLLHSMNESCKRHCCEPAQRSNHYELEDIRHPRRRNKKESKDDDDDDDDIDDPCSSCYHCGCNVATRNETLGKRNPHFTYPEVLPIQTPINGFWLCIK